MVGNRITEVPVFVWWNKHVLIKRDQNNIQDATILDKTHKYGIRVTKTVKEAVRIYQDNGDTLWWDDIMQKIKKFRTSFEVWVKRKEDLPIGY